MENDGVYRDYDDWYDNGPGSESFKRSLRARRIVDKIKIRVLTEKEYTLGDKAMIQLTINLPKHQWLKWRQRFISALALIRRS